MRAGSGADGGEEPDQRIRTVLRVGGGTDEQALDGLLVHAVSVHLVSLSAATGRGVTRETTAYPCWGG
ncbi:hypothetical protein GCM10010169_41500 [Micromonospora fulviviridis]|nr:hypothetical protein GCM10010169_41500 [Micromonospora fulviviridis]